MRLNTARAELATIAIVTMAASPLRADPVGKIQAIVGQDAISAERTLHDRGFKSQAGQPIPKSRQGPALR